MKPRELIKPYFVSRWRVIALGLVSLIIVDFLQLMVPRVIKWAVDDLTLLRASGSGLLRYAAAIAVLALFIGGFRYVWRRCLLGTARYLEADLRNRLLTHLQTLSAGFFDRTKTGDLMAHATNDIQQVRMAAGMGLVALNDAIVLGAAAIGFMLYIHVELTLYVLIPMPLVVLSARLLGRRLHHRYQGVQAAFSDLTEAVRERLAGMRMIKAHNAEGASLAAVESVSRDYVAQNMRLVGVTGVFFPLMVMLTNLSLAVVLYFGGRKAILNEITPGDFVAFISYLGLLSWPMMALGWVTNLIQRGGASLQRLGAIFEQQPEIRNASSAKRLPSVRGDIVFDGVTFSYDRDPRHAVLSDIRLEIRPGEVLGIVGAPGSGKSTLLSLVPRLYDATRGRLTIDGMDVRDIDLADLRRQVAYVPQEPFLFAGTVGENLMFGCPRDCAARFDQVAADAGLTETLAHLPAGLETRVGEKGVLLSGGQKQRIALARALLVDAPILLLDDPISQVDTQTAAVIVAAIRRMAGRKTILIASHRLSAVRFADQIVTLDNGRLVEAGTHEQLLSTGGYYARVHGLQELEHAR
ncbi:ABC transporter ATP-binding protein [Desulfatitalea tepidiphila]|uniref:ABC transporter ATP-binding protein n=1 Tax=Desulfatitalea tepidiphila TaxID=1185843 RepID=UPI0006B60BC6|nr:ABC transporter ATP-binding protein [Desulfatitalea tepidiphila]